MIHGSLKQNNPAGGLAGLEWDSVKAVEVSHQRNFCGGSHAEFALRLCKQLHPLPCRVETHGSVRQQANLNLISFDLLE